MKSNGVDGYFGVETIQIKSLGLRDYLLVFFTMLLEEFFCNYNPLLKVHEL